MNLVMKKLQAFPPELKTQLSIFLNLPESMLSYSNSKERFVDSTTEIELQLESLHEIHDSFHSVNRN